MEGADDHDFRRRRRGRRLCRRIADGDQRAEHGGDFAAAETVPALPTSGYSDFDFNICADSEPGEPGPFTLDNSVWWNWTPGQTGTATISTEDGGGNEIARITKTWEGLARTMFTTADNYVVQIHQRLQDPLRAMVVASAVTVDTALKQDSRGFG